MRRILEDPKISKPLVLGFCREYFDYYRAPEVFKDPLPDYLQRRSAFNGLEQAAEQLFRGVVAASSSLDTIETPAGPVASEELPSTTPETAETSE